MREAFVKMLGNADEMVTGVALDISDETRERKFYLLSLFAAYKLFLQRG